MPVSLRDNNRGIAFHQDIWCHTTFFFFQTHVACSFRPTDYRPNSETGQYLFHCLPNRLTKVIVRSQSKSCLPWIAYILLLSLPRLTKKKHVLGQRGALLFPSLLARFRTSARKELKDQQVGSTRQTLTVSRLPTWPLHLQASSWLFGTPVGLSLSPTRRERSGLW